MVPAAEGFGDSVTPHTSAPQVYKVVRFTAISCSSRMLLQVKCRWSTTGTLDLFDYCCLRRQAWWARP